MKIFEEEGKLITFVTVTLISTQTFKEVKTNCFQHPFLHFMFYIQKNNVKIKQILATNQDKEVR